jgi:hypothetical protein
MDIDTLPVSSPFSSGLIDLFVVLGAILLVVLIAFFWALLIRKSGKRRRKYHHGHHPESYREQIQKGAGEIKELIRQHRRGRHREHRPLNPTLAQTGGLPPLRKSEKPPLPPPPP